MAGGDFVGIGREGAVAEGTGGADERDALDDYDLHPEDGKRGVRGAPSGFKGSAGDAAFGHGEELHVSGKSGQGRPHDGRDGVRGDERRGKNRAQAAPGPGL